MLSIYLFWKSFFYFIQAHFFFIQIVRLILGDLRNVIKLFHKNLFSRFWRKYESSFIDYSKKFTPRLRVALKNKKFILKGRTNCSENDT